MENSESAKHRFALGKMFLRESFLERASLLIITAIISGLMIPEISYRIQAQNQKQEIVLANQAELLDDLTNTLMTYESLVLDVTWYKSNEAVYNQEMHLKAYERYTSRVPDLIAELRTGMLKAKYLASPAMEEKLNQFHERIFSEQDTPLTMLMNKKDASVADWSQLHNTNMIMATQANTLLEAMAKDFKITKEYGRN